MMIKKGWDYDFKSVAINSMAAILGFGVGVTLIFILLERYNIVNEMYVKVYNMSILFLGLYPIFIFKNIAPQLGSDKVYMSTTNLPYSKKQLLFKGTKWWMMILPAYILLGSIIVTILDSSMGSFLSKYLTNTVESIGVILFAFIICLYIFIGVMLHLIRGYKGSKIIVMIGLSFLVVGCCIKAIFIINLASKNLVIGAILLAYLIGSVVIGKKLWADIENIHR